MNESIRGPGSFASRYFFALVLAVTFFYSVRFIDWKTILTQRDEEEKVVYHREPLNVQDDPKRLKPTDLITNWGMELEDNKKTIPWPEYPRPLLRRSDATWRTLNGLWDFTVTTLDSPEGADGVPVEREWDGSIRVPFCIESRLSGVMKPLPLPQKIPAQFSPENINSVRRVVLWYRRRFNLPSGVAHSIGSDYPGDDKGKRYFLHFEAVDYEASIWVNGKLQKTVTGDGAHKGGFVPFTIDITSAVNIDGSVSTPQGAHELVVRVMDDTEGAQLRGKQSKFPKSIWYSSCSGITQSVWIETVPRQHIKSIATHTKHGPRQSIILTVNPVISASKSTKSKGAGTLGSLPPGFRVECEVRGTGSSHVTKGSSNINNLVPPAVTATITDPKLWSPDTPYLYDITIRLVYSHGDGTLSKESLPEEVVVDEVLSYVALREIGKIRGEDGHLRLTLNGQPIFHLGVLDQGMWPDGILTPPSDAAQLRDIEFIKSAGFNTIRKHVKVENRRYYYHCDRLGLLVWQDQVSADQNGQDRTGLSPQWTRFQNEPQEGTWTDEDHSQFMFELAEMVDMLDRHPCVVMWVAFNEAWGQHRTIDVARWLKKRDPSRLVNAASGGNFFPVGDVADNHNYPAPTFKNSDSSRFRDYIKVVGEFGGHGLAVNGHLFSEAPAPQNNGGKHNWGYGRLPKHATELKEYYRSSMSALGQLKRHHGIAAGIFTQTSDVEGEVNGLMTYDRKVAKIDPLDLREWNEALVVGDGIELR